MKFILVVAAICVATVYADHHECPRVREDSANQLEVQKIYERINRPYRTVTERPQFDTTTFTRIGRLPRNKTFSAFDEHHWEEVEAILDELIPAKPFDYFIKKSEAIRQMTNEGLFVFAFTTAVIHRKYSDGIKPVAIQEVFPDKFFTQQVIAQIKEATHFGEKNVVVNETFNYDRIMDVNNRVTYFTEDPGMNGNHFNWHALNPAIWAEKYGRKKGRRGEAFYWMHRQMLARYDAERLSNYLPRTAAFEEWDAPIMEGYAPHLAVDRTGYDYAFRPEGLKLRDLPRVSKNQMQRWRNRIWDSIHKGSVFAINGTKIRIDQQDPFGTEVIANLVESSRQTVNRPYYGNLHNYAHLIAARITDPYGRYEQSEGAMYDVITSARDPFFYRWHKFIDNIFQDYKDSLQPYKKEKVTWREVTIESVEIKGEKSPTPNLITTYWETHPYRIGKFFSFTAQSTAEVRVTHLQHENFNYKFVLVNNAGDNKEALFRVYLAPKYDEFGRMFTIDEIRPMLIEMDRFVMELKPGKNTINRASYDSSITGPDRFARPDSSAKPDSLKDDCRCRWPNYLLVPRGRYQGMQYRLIVAVTNWAEDSQNVDTSCACKGAPSYCRLTEIRDYDTRPYGYPFDRRIENVKKCEDLSIQNIFFSNLTIKFTGESTAN